MGAGCWILTARLQQSSQVTVQYIHVRLVVFVACPKNIMWRVKCGWCEMRLMGATVPQLTTNQTMPGEQTRVNLLGFQITSMLSYHILLMSTHIPTLQTPNMLAQSHSRSNHSHNSKPFSLYQPGKASLKSQKQRSLKLS